VFLVVGLGSMESLKRLFYPHSVAVIGASDNPFKMGYHCLRSLIGFRGAVYPVNPNASTIQGFKAYPSILDVPGDVDLAVIVVPARQVPPVIEECAGKGVKGAVIITAGFRETGEIGASLQEEVVSIAKRAGMRILGPNTFGFVNTHAGLNATFTETLGELEKGDIAVVTQSGGVCHLFCYEAITQGLGVSKAVGLGNRCDVDFPEMLDYLASDEETRVIALHIEGLDNPREFMEAAKRTVKVKPVVAYKVGRAEVNRESMSHTGSMAGDYRLYDALFKQSGVVDVGSVVELLDVAKALSFLPPPRGGRVAVVSVQAGPAIIISDVCKSNGLTLPEFTEETRRRIESLLPPMTIRSNPVDLAFAYSVETFMEVIRLVADDSNVDVVVVFQLHHPVAPVMVDELVGVFRESGKPFLFCFNAPRSRSREEVERLEKGGIPVYPTPERVARAVVGLVKYGRVLRKPL